MNVSCDRGLFNSTCAGTPGRETISLPHRICNDINTTPAGVAQTTCRAGCRSYRATPAVIMVRSGIQWPPRLGFLQGLQIFDKMLVYGPNITNWFTGQKNCKPSQLLLPERNMFLLITSFYILNLFIYLHNAKNPAGLRCKI